MRPHEYLFKLRIICVSVILRFACFVLLVLFFRKRHGSFKLWLPRCRERLAVYHGLDYGDTSTPKQGRPDGLLILDNLEDY